MPAICHRKLWSGLVVVALACAAITGGAGRASAGPDHSAGLDQGGAGGSIGLSDEGPVTKPVATETGNNPARPRYLVVNAGRCLLDEIRHADGTRTPVWGTTWLTVLADENSDGTSNVVDAVCARAAPPPPPPPPTPTEIWQFVPLTKSEIGINPRGDGLTDLDTWLWHEGSRTGVEVAPNLRGYSLVVKARPVLYASSSSEAVSRAPALAPSTRRRFGSSFPGLAAITLRPVVQRRPKAAATGLRTPTRPRLTSEPRLRYTTRA